MTTLPKNVRRFALILGSVLVAGPLVTVLTSAAQAPAQPVTAAPSFVITTKVTGKPRHVATARLCLQSEATGVVGPCLMVPVGIA